MQTSYLEFVNFKFEKSFLASLIIIWTSVKVAGVTQYLFFSCQKQSPEVFFKKGVMQICSKFTGEHLCRNVISIGLHVLFSKVAYNID